MGCTVFTTVGSKEKREFLKRRFPQLQDRNFANSRDLSFEEHILYETKGRGECAKSLALVKDVEGMHEHELMYPIEKSTKVLPVSRTWLSAPVPPGMLTP
ncbi:hypothetical protein MTO96_040883 [Rhipicephalus appendiculatus]